MTDRIKAVRKHAGLSQEEFGNRIGVSNSAISYWEKGERNIPDSAILLICREFGVDEIWLRTGEGDMFAPRSREDEIAAFVKDIMTDSGADFQRRFIAVLSRLDDKGWTVLERIADALENEKKADP